MIGLLLLKNIYCLSDEGVCASAGSTTTISSASPTRSFSRTTPAPALRPEPLAEAARQQALLAKSLRVSMRELRSEQ